MSQPQHSDQPPTSVRPFREYLVEWAREVGRTCAYSFDQPENEAEFVREQLHAVRDIVPRQKDAHAFLMKEVRRGFDDCFGWSWCLRDKLTPLFQRRASKEEIEATARKFQGALPDKAVVSLLRVLRSQYWDAPDNVVQFQPRKRKRA